MNSYGVIFTIYCIAGKLSRVDQTTGHYVEILVSAKSCSGRGYKLVRLIRDRLLEFGPSRHQTKIFLSSKTSIHVANMARPTDTKQERISGGGRAILQNLPNCGAVGSPKMGSGRRWKIKGRVHEIRDMSAEVWVHMTGVHRPVDFTFEGKATKQQQTWTDKGRHVLSQLVEDQFPNF